jgi:hypothetical protein
MFFVDMTSFLTLARNNGDGKHGDGSLFLVFRSQTIMIFSPINGFCISSMGREDILLVVYFQSV